MNGKDAWRKRPRELEAAGPSGQLPPALPVDGMVRPGGWGGSEPTASLLPSVARSPSPFSCVLCMDRFYLFIACFSAKM